MKYEAIEKYSSEFCVKRMCKVLELVPSNYYRWKRNKEKKQEKQKEELQLVRKIEKIFEASHKTYGYRVIREVLKRENIEISEYRVRKIMKENGLYPETRKKYNPARNRKKDGKYFKNLIEQNFRTEEKDQVWVGDITYIRTVLGWVYLAVVMDLYNREVIGYAISKKIDTELVKRALGNALAKRERKAGLIFHSDRGSQYASKDYQKMLEENQITGSMSRGGCPYDNSCVESFFCNNEKRKNIPKKSCYNGRSKSRSVSVYRIIL